MDYEKALEKARAAYGTGAYDDATLEFIFPQIKESEDERIIKTLQEYVKNRNWMLNGPSQREVLAYLEKLKERGPLTKEEEYTLHRIIEYLEDETCPSEWISLLHDIYCLPYEKQKEQKPAEWDELQAEFRNINEAFEDGKKEVVAHPEKYGLCKPAEWSDKDEKVYAYLKSGFEYASNNPKLLNSILSGASDATIQDYRNFIDKLKILRPQPKQEWSEEDEKILNELITIMDGGKVTSGTYLSEYVAWLKSLRPSWKPSEDQERLINTSISFLKDFADKGYENAVECIDWLKSKSNGNSGK